MILTLVNSTKHLILWNSSFFKRCSIFDYYSSNNIGDWTESTPDGFVDIYVGF